jgi:hypothetical protein
MERIIEKTHGYLDEKTVLTQNFLAKTPKFFFIFLPEFLILIGTCTEFFSTSTFNNILQFFEFLFSTKFS